MNAVLPFAEKMLLRNGVFFPYGSALDPDGKVVAVGVYDGREHPPSKDIILLYKEAFRQGAMSGKYAATALVYDVRITLPSSNRKPEAIAVSLNHRNDYSVVIFFPYEIKKDRIQFGEAIAQKGEADIFESELLS
ncbi:MAG: hypothetical protein ACP5SH_07535 [Syntrophobacteraceae bacterium]